MKIEIIGLGYIGLPTAAMLASRQIEVVGVDINQYTVDTINRGEIHIVEPDLDIRFDLLCRPAICGQLFGRRRQMPLWLQYPLHLKVTMSQI